MLYDLLMLSVLWIFFIFILNEIENRNLFGSNYKMKVYLMQQHECCESGYLTKHVFIRFEDAWKCAVAYYKQNLELGEGIFDKEWVEQEKSKTIEGLKKWQEVECLENYDLHYTITKLSLH